jgi:hypothetical protein
MIYSGCPVTDAPCVYHLGLVQVVDSNLCVVCVCGDMCVRYVVCELDQLVLE